MVMDLREHFTVTRLCRHEPDFHNVDRPNGTALAMAPPLRRLLPHSWSLPLSSVGEVMAELHDHAFNRATQLELDTRRETFSVDFHTRTDWRMM